MAIDEDAIRSEIGALKNLLAQKRISLPFSISLTHKENHEEGKIRCN